jgi:hypothetical protein
VSYLASLPGGPPAAAVCIRAGWKMGKAKDIYMRYVTAGDEFVGRCLCLHLVLRTDHGAFPPHFLSFQYDWIKPGRRLQFPMVRLVIGWERIKTMCLASILFHNSWLLNILPVNHLVIATSHVYHSGDLLAQSEFVTVSYPWDDAENV